VGQLLEEGRRIQSEAMLRLFDPSDEGSPLARHRAEVLGAVRQESELVRRAVSEVAERLAVREATAACQEKSSLKGVAYEDLVHRAVGRLVTPFGDLAEQTGREPGASGTLKGDEVITLNPEDSGGRSLRYALEIKDRRLGMKAIMDELEEAKANRCAEAVVAVFSSDANSPAASPFVYTGGKAIVVFDKQTRDDGPLRLACLWARWMARREAQPGSGTLDLQAAEACLKDATRALERAATIRRCHGTALKKITEAGDQLDGLASEAASALDALQAVLRT
jgi:hypothetical protein